jgi:hypothetical protein
VAVVVAIIAGLMAARGYIWFPGHHSDFGQVWFGSRSVLHGIDPYPLVGPGLSFDWAWPLSYPVPALLVAAPLSYLSEGVASSIFSAISAGCLAWFSTRESWHRLPAFGSGALALAAGAAQWSPIFAASWFFAPISLVFAAKPTLALALAASTSSRRALAWAVGFGVVLFGLSFLALPSWIGEWANAVRDSGPSWTSPITQWGGIFTLACLLRWRRPEALLILAMACAPQSSSIYDCLILLVIIPDTYREATILSLASSFGFFLMMLAPSRSEAEFHSALGAIRVVTCYLPATIIVLRRPNVGPGPAWMSFLRSRVDNVVTKIHATADA